MRYFASAFWLMLLLLVGCATREGAPDWVSGTAAKYPNAHYLIGRGQGASGEEARDRARADLAKIFEVNVAVESEDVQAFRSASGGQYDGHSQRRIVTRSERVLEGVEIAETWRDAATGAQHALAVLPRAKAATALRQEIARLDSATQLQLDRARSAQDLLIKIGAAAQALSAQSERIAYQKSLRIVEASGRGDEPAISVARLQADLDALLKRVKLAPRVAAGANDGVASVVKGAVAASGFLADTGATPDYVLEAALSLDDLGAQEGWYWQRGTLEVRLIETATQRVRGTQRWSIKASALAREGAVQRALGQVDQILKKELRSTLIGFAAVTDAGS